MSVNQLNLSKSKEIAINFKEIIHFLYSFIDNPSEDTELNSLIFDVADGLGNIEILLSE